ncbi:MAG TPA: energy-coupling factor transporter transmembrane component T, partial [Thermomicrobiales bacterium]|nr:energy-coupling factor transporter transmembrane component T [Thermomicrobiales bacterium]
MNTLDSRAWVAWGLAAMLPVLLGRNPWLLLEVLLILFVVRFTWLPPSDERRMGWFLRIAGVLIVFGVAFNVLTVHAGNVVVATLPDAWPVIGGDLTLNALVYGILSGAAVFTLILIGITVTALVSWLDLFHHLPPRLATVAVTGSVAWSFLPRLAESWVTIREAQAMRGNRLHGPRAILPLVTPLLTSSLERALVTAEVLEARGFGGTIAAADITSRRRGVGGVLLATALVPFAVAAFCFAVGRVGWGVTCLVLASAMLAAGFCLDPQPGPHRSRLLETAWTWSDTATVATAAISIVAVLGLAASDAPALT